MTITKITPSDEGLTEVRLIDNIPYKPVIMEQSATGIRIHWIQLSAAEAREIVKALTEHAARQESHNG